MPAVMEWHDMRHNFNCEGSVSTTPNVPTTFTHFDAIMFLKSSQMPFHPLELEDGTTCTWAVFSADSLAAFLTF